MTKKNQLILIALVAVIIPSVIVTSSDAKRSAAQKFAHNKNSDISTRLPIPVQAKMALQNARSDQQGRSPVRPYSERMGKGKEETAKYGADISEMSSMGRRAYLQASEREEVRKGGKGINLKSGGGCLSDDEDCEHDGGVGLNDKQSEMGIAVDPSGLHVVVGYNDAQGFATNPNKLSGFATSHDGGVTFTTIGTMPSPGNQNIGATLFPQIFGDPDVKWLPAPSTPNGGVFIYSSIEVRTITGPSTIAGTVQTMCIHRSLDFGDTWQGPFEVTPASNPNGIFSGNNARDAADKEFIDVDPDTGRVMVAWSNFTSGAFSPVGKQMFTTFSDDLATAATPTWSARQNVNLASSIPGQGIIPRFAGNGSPNVYVAYQSQTTALAAQTFFARSTDNGVSFSPAVALTAGTYKVMDYVLGNDRSHDFPWMAVDNSPVVATQGNVYVVYADNTLNDGSDIVFLRSIDGGLNFTAPVRLNARPGQDRPQWFPVVTVDTTSGRVWVFYFDQGVADSGDAMETSAVYSDDGGVTWSRQIALSDRPYHAGYGNDTGQPNLGDYNMGYAQGGNLFSTFAYTPDVVNFPDGQPLGTLPAIDFFFKKTSETPARAALEIRNNPPGGVSMLEKPATLTGELTIPLTNIVTNPLGGPVTYTGVSALLTTGTPNITVTSGASTYPNIASGTTANNNTLFTIHFDAGFVFGTKVNFALDVTTAQGNRTLQFSVNTGNKPTTTTLLSENFESVATPALPAGWSTLHGGGTNTVPWLTAVNMPKTNTPSPSNKGLFHANANDAANPTRFERALSPLFVVPAASTFVSVSFDIAYDTEDDPSFLYQAYDGALLRITDQTAGRLLRSVLTEAYADIQTTGNIFHYPKHFPRNSSAAYFEDMSAWSGDSTAVAGNNAGFLHVVMLFPGMAGSTAQLRFEFAQDSNGICTDVRPADTNCGVLVDNIVVQNITYNAPTAAAADIAGQILTPDGQPAAGVVMQLSGSRSAKTITDSSGKYTFRQLDTGQLYTVTPALMTYNFSPAQRSFSLLANVTDAAFTATRDAVVFGNVIDSPEYFVRQHYLDFLNREPDQEGFNFWSNQITECGNDLTCMERRTINVSAAFFISGEFQQTGSYIYRLYQAALGRQLSYAEFSQDRQRIIFGEALERTREVYVEQFVERPDFLQKYGATSSPESYVDTLLQTVRQCSGVDLNSMRGSLIDKYNSIHDNREKRPEVLKDVIEAASFKQAVYNPSFVLMEYFGYLRRDPDESGYAFWLNKLNQFDGNFERAEMVKAFIVSGEYRNRFRQ